MEIEKRIEKMAKLSVTSQKKIQCAVFLVYGTTVTVTSAASQSDLCAGTGLADRCRTARTTTEHVTRGVAYTGEGARQASSSVGRGFGVALETCKANHSPTESSGIASWGIWRCPL